MLKFNGTNTHSTQLFKLYKYRPKDAKVSNREPKLTLLSAQWTELIGQKLKEVKFSAPTMTITLLLPIL